MKIKKIAAHDVDVIIPFLEHHIQTNIFMLNNFKTGGLNPSKETLAGDYFGLFDDTATLQGVMAHYNSGSLMLQVPKNLECIAELAKTLLSATKRPIRAILGEASQVEQILQTLHIPDEHFDMQETESLMELNIDDTQLIPKNDSFTFLHNKDIPNEIITDWMVNYDVEALGTKPSAKHRQETKEEIIAKEHTKNRWGLKFENHFVAYGGFNAAYKKTVQVGPMWTPVELRSKGYARYLLSRMLEWAKNEGHTKCILFTNTLPAIRSYQSIGFKETGAFKLCILNKPYMFKG